MLIHATDVHFVRQCLGETQVEFAKRFAKSRADVARWEHEGVDFSHPIDQDMWRHAEIAARMTTKPKKGIQTMKEPKPKPAPMCGNCLFFIPEVGAPIDGFCRRFPPHVEFVIAKADGIFAGRGDDQRLSLRTMQPLVEKGYWCGEHAKLE